VKVKLILIKKVLRVMKAILPPEEREAPSAANWHAALNSCCLAGEELFLSH
jgi:hypothetical protein